MKKLLLYRVSFLLAACFMNSAVAYCNEPKKVENTNKEIDSLLKELEDGADEIYLDGLSTCKNIVRRTEGTNGFGKKVISYFQRTQFKSLSTICINNKNYWANISMFDDVPQWSLNNAKIHFDRLAKLWHEQNKANEKQQ